MSIIRIKKNANYTTVSNVIFKDPNISAKAKGLFAYIMTLPDNWKLYKTELHNHFTDGKDSMRSAFSELQRAGYITGGQVTGNKGHFAGCAYTVHESPILGQPILENPKSETPPLLNTNNTNRLIKENTNNICSSSDELVFNSNITEV